MYSFQNSRLVLFSNFIQEKFKFLPLLIQSAQQM